MADGMKKLDPETVPPLDWIDGYKHLAAMMNKLLIQRQGLEDVRDPDIYVDQPSKEQRTATTVQAKALNDELCTSYDSLKQLSSAEKLPDAIPADRADDPNFKWLRVSEEVMKQEVDTAPNTAARLIRDVLRLMKAVPTSYETARSILLVRSAGVVHDSIQRMIDAGETFPNVCERVYDRFAQKRSRQSQLAEMENFVRDDNETLHGAVGRLTDIAREVYSGHPDKDTLVKILVTDRIPSLIRPEVADNFKVELRRLNARGQYPLPPTLVKMAEREEFGLEPPAVSLNAITSVRSDSRDRGNTGAKRLRTRHRHEEYARSPPRQSDSHVRYEDELGATKPTPASLTPTNPPSQNFEYGPAQQSKRNQYRQSDQRRSNDYGSDAFQTYRHRSQTPGTTDNYRNRSTERNYRRDYSRDRNDSRSRNYRGDYRSQSRDRYSRRRSHSRDRGRSNIPRRIKAHLDKRAPICYDCLLDLRRCYPKQFDFTDFIQGSCELCPE